MALMKAFLCDLAEFLGVDLCAKTGLDLVAEYDDNVYPMPRWVYAAARVRAAIARRETPVPDDVEAARREFCLWPAWDSGVEKSLPRYRPRWWDDPELIDPAWSQKVGAA